MVFRNLCTIQNRSIKVKNCEITVVHHESGLRRECFYGKILSKKTWTVSFFLKEKKSASDVF